MRRLLASALLALLLSPVCRAKTLSVGTCNPKVPFYGTIQTAVDAAKPGDTIRVCAGTYHESVLITKPLTLIGVQSGTNGIVIIQGGTRIAGTLSGPSGDVAAVHSQVLIQETGPVNINNITVDASNTGYSPGRPNTYLAGVYFYNSSGTATGMVVRGQQVGIWLENNSSSLASVAVDANVIESSSLVGIFVSSNGTSNSTAEPTLSFEMKSNTLGRNGGAAIDIRRATGGVSNNTIFGGPRGIVVNAGSSSGVLANILVGVGVAIDVASSGNTVAMNRLFNTDYGIRVGGSGNLIQGNEISVGAVTGIDFQCNSVTGNNASSNFINDTVVGIANIPGQNDVAENAFFNVGTTMTTCP